MLWKGCAAVFFFVALVEGVLLFGVARTPPPSPLVDITTARDELPDVSKRLANVEYELGELRQSIEMLGQLRNTGVPVMADGDATSSTVDSASTNGTSAAEALRALDDASWSGILERSRMREIVMMLEDADAGSRQAVLDELRRRVMNGELRIGRN